MSTDAQPGGRTHVVALLDELVAAERAGGEALAHWLVSCKDARLRGGLRVLRARDAAHVALAERRLAALGATPSAAPSRTLNALCELLAAPAVPDAAKLRVLLARLPRSGADALGAAAARLDDDAESRALLDGMAEDDRTSLRWLHAQPGLPPRAPRLSVAAGADEVAGFLDAFRAAEAASSAVFAAWSAATPLARLRGGLRVIAAREATHATVCAERLHDLHVLPHAAVDDEAQQRATAWFGDPARGDDEKLAALLARLGDAHAATAPVTAAADRFGGDLETREMLQLITATERATSRWLQAYRVALADGEPAALARVAS